MAGMSEILGGGNYCIACGGSDSKAGEFRYPAWSGPLYTGHKPMCPKGKVGQPIHAGFWKDPDVWIRVTGRDGKHELGDLIRTAAKDIWEYRTAVDGRIMRFAASSGSNAPDLYGKVRVEMAGRAVTTDALALVESWIKRGFLFLKPEKQAAQIVFSNDVKLEDADAVEKEFKEKFKIDG